LQRPFPVPSSQSPFPGLLSRTNNDHSSDVKLLSFTMIMTNITQHLHDTFVMMQPPGAQRRCRIVVVRHHCRHRRLPTMLPLFSCVWLWWRCCFSRLATSFDIYVSSNEGLYFFLRSKRIDAGKSPQKISVMCQVSRNDDYQSNLIGRGIVLSISTTTTYIVA